MNAPAAARPGCALVTGAGRGIGAACARVLAQDGWAVAVHYRSSADGARSVVDAITAAGGRAVAVGGDLTDDAARVRVVDLAVDAFGPVLALVNNAGVQERRMIGSTKDEHWDDVLDLNLTVPFQLIRQVVPHMMRARYGRVVNIGSVGASIPVPGQVGYTASKGGLEALARATAAEVARRGITVNTVAPGLIAADGQDEAIARLVQRADAVIPARRAGTPEDVAACVRFLASDDAEYVNGTVLTVDGALSASPVPLTTLLANP